MLLTEINNEKIENLTKKDIPSKVKHYFDSIPNEILSEVQCILNCNGLTVSENIIEYHSELVHDNNVKFIETDKSKFNWFFNGVVRLITNNDNYFEYLTIYLRE